jgi:hypothetical protein
MSGQVSCRYTIAFSPDDLVEFEADRRRRKVKVEKPWPSTGRGTAASTTTISNSTVVDFTARPSAKAA